MIRKFESFIEKDLEQEAKKIYFEFIGNKKINFSNQYIDMMSDFYSVNYSEDEWNEIINILKIEFFK